jgi:hypothetical protein
MDDTLNDISNLFEEAKQKSEFDFVLTLMNYKGIGASELMTNLHEWFDAIEFYKTLYNSLQGKEKVRIGTLIYSTFFENSDFYNILGSLCRIKLGYKGSSYLLWKTKKYERLLGIGEKQDFLLELLDDAGKQNIIDFFEQNHHKEVRNSFFHSAYSLTDTEYIFHDSDPIFIGGVGQSQIDIQQFLIPKIDKIISVFDRFKHCYISSFNSYTTDKQVNGLFPNQVLVTILGSKQGLKGFKIKNAVQFYGQFHDSGIWFDENFNMWAGHNINMYLDNIETIEIREQLKRYINKPDINKSDADFINLIDKVKERKIPAEVQTATQLLVKFGNVRFDKMDSEQNENKKKSFVKIILPYYEKALEIGEIYFDMTDLKSRIEQLKEE